MLTFEEFENQLLPEWYSNFFLKTLEKAVNTILIIAEPFEFHHKIEKLSKSNQLKYKLLCRKHFDFSAIMNGIIYVRNLSNNLLNLPISTNFKTDINNTSIPKQLLETNSYIDFLELSLSYSKIIQKEFKKISKILI